MCGVGELLEPLDVFAEASAAVHELGRAETVSLS
jgi:hypothetical protein